MNKENSPNVTSRLFVMYVCVLEIGTKPHMGTFSVLFRETNIVFWLPSFLIVYFSILILELTAEIWTESEILSLKNFHFVGVFSYSQMY